MTKTKNKKIWIGVIVALVLCAAVVCAVLYARADMVASELTTDEAQTLIENALDAMPGANARASVKYIAEVSRPFRLHSSRSASKSSADMIFAW